MCAAAESPADRVSYWDVKSGVPVDRTRSWWGWENVEDAAVGEECEQLSRRVLDLLPNADLTVHEPPPIEAFTVAPSRILAPAALASIVSDATPDRLAHTRAGV
jgi:alkyldihydroxyacetonephosphate synthase